MLGNTLVNIGLNQEKILMLHSTRVALQWIPSSGLTSSALSSGPENGHVARISPALMHMPLPLLASPPKPLFIFNLIVQIALGIWGQGIYFFIGGS